MIRIHVICEGETEEMFVNELLTPSFSARNIFPTPSSIGTTGHQGGNIKFERLLDDVELFLLGDKTAYCTTFFDFYGLHPKFPGREEALTKNGAQEKSRCLLEALTKQLCEKLGAEPMRRFIPYVQMYEFEGLLFSDTGKFAHGIGIPAFGAEFQKIRSGFDSPEEINNNPNTAPSKRILQLYPAYKKQKPRLGRLAAQEIGLPAIRRECRLFDAWLKKLESLPPIEPMA